MKLKTLKQLLAVMASSSVIGSVAYAEPVAVSNYSFEQPAQAIGSGDYYGSIPGWISFGGGSGFIGNPPSPQFNNYPGASYPTTTNNLPGTADGFQYFHVNGSAAGGPGGIYQDVGPIQPNTTYTLSVAIGQRSDIASGQGIVSLVNGTGNTGTVLASSNVDVTVAPSGSFGDIIVTYTTGSSASGDLTVVLQSTAGTQIGFDNVRVDAAIPANATSLSVSNFSFEADVQADGGQTTSTAPTGWGGFGPSIGTIRPDGGADFPTFISPASPPPNNVLPPTGDAYQCAYVNGGSGIFQDVGPLQPGKTYTLKVAIGARATVNWGEGLGVIQLVNGTNNSGTVLVSQTVNNTNPPSGGAFNDFVTTFTTSGTVSGDLTVVFNTTTAVQICYDNVRLYTQTPTSLAPAVPAPTLSPAVAFAGDLVTANDAATGPGPLYYSWQYDNGTGGTSWTTLSSYAPNSSYVKNTTGLNLSAYEFRVVVTNAYGASTSAPVTLTMTNGMPVSLQNPLPSLEEFTATETAQFTAAFTGTRPLTYQWQVDHGSGLVNVTNGTFNSPTLTITNLQVTDSGNYTLVTSNSYGTATNSAIGQLTVNALPAQDAAGNILLYSHEGNSQPYTPTYVLASNNLIAAAAPSDIGSGNFQQEGCSGYPILTDNLLGQPGQHSEYATVGIGGGTYVTYTLNTNASPNGYNLNRIVAIGGWADLNRNQVSADVYYSTISNPTTFVLLDSYSYNGGVNNFWGNPTVGVQVVPASAWLATNVASIKFDFTGPGGTGGGGFGYSGLSELQVFGQANSPSPITLTKSGSNIVLNWTSGILYEASNVTGPWTIVSGAVSPYTVSPTAPRMFYRLQ